MSKHLTFSEGGGVAGLKPPIKFDIIVTCGRSSHREIHWVSHLTISGG